MKKLIQCVSILIILTASVSLGAAPLPKWAQTPQLSEVDSLSLKESVLRALGRNPSIAEQAAQAGIGQAQITEAQSAWRPQIGLGGNTGSSTQNDVGNSLNNSASYGLTLTQLVYDFGKTTDNIKQQQATSDSYHFKLMATIQDVAEQTSIAYVQVMRYEALVKVVQENIDSLSNVQNMAHLRFDAGLSTSSDVLQAGTRIAGMRSTLQDYQAQLKTAKAQLAVLAGVQAKQYQTLPDSLVTQPVKLDHIEYSTISSVEMAESQQQAAVYGVEKEKASRWPTLSLQGNRTHYQGGGDSYWNNQLQLNVQAPIYQGGAVTARVEEAEGAQKMSESAVEQSKLDVLQKASVALASWDGARGREDAGTQQLSSAKKTREVYKNEYKLSTRSLNDLLSVEQDVFQAEYSQIIADYDGWVAAVNYASAVNNLLELTGIIQSSGNGLPELN